MAHSSYQQLPAATGMWETEDTPNHDPSFTSPIQNTFHDLCRRWICKIIPKDLRKVRRARLQIKKQAKHWHMRHKCDSCMTGLGYTNIRPEALKKQTLLPLAGETLRQKSGIDLLNVSKNALMRRSPNIKSRRKFRRVCIVQSHLT